MFLYCLNLPNCAFINFKRRLNLFGYLNCLRKTLLNINIVDFNATAEHKAQVFIRA